MSGIFHDCSSFLQGSFIFQELPWLQVRNSRCSFYWNEKNWPFHLISRHCSFPNCVQTNVLVGVLTWFSARAKVLISPRLWKMLWFIELLSFLFLSCWGDSEKPRTTWVPTSTHRWESGISAQVKSDYCVPKQPCLHTSMSNKALKRVKIARDAAV